MTYAWLELLSFSDSIEWLVVDESDKLFEEGKTGFRDQVNIYFSLLILLLLEVRVISMLDSSMHSS